MKLIAKIALLFVVWIAMLLLLATVANAAHPYDSVCRVLTRTSGGSGTLIYNEPGKYALVLGAKHVSPDRGEWVSCTWGDTTCEGIAWKVHPMADICVMMVASPPGLRPVQAALPSPATGPFVAAGFPSYSRGKLHYQVGNFKDRDTYTLYTTKAPWSGMSGGACFDRYGRIVGVVVTAHPSITRGAYGGMTSYQALGDILGGN